MLNKKTKMLAVELILILCFLTLLPSLAKSEVTVSVGDGEGPPGSIGNTVAVSMENQNDQTKGIQADICDADDYLTCTGCETTDRSAGFTCVTSPQNGCVRVLLMDISGVNIIETGEGSILTLKYDVSAEAPSGQCDNLTLEEIKVSDKYGDPLEVTSVSGEFCFGEVAPFELLSPSNGATLDNTPTFEWTSGSYDAFLFFSVFNYAGLGYYPVPFWLPNISLQMPANWWNLLAPDVPCIWVVLGYNTSTSEHEWSDVWWFRKAP